MIRKIIIGSNLKDAMAFYVGQELFNKHVVHSIERGYYDGSYDLYLKRDGEIYKWKTFNGNLPITLEYNLDFD